MSSAAALQHISLYRPPATPPPPHRHHLLCNTLSNCNTLTSPHSQLSYIVGIESEEKIVTQYMDCNALEDYGIEIRARQGTMDSITEFERQYVGIPDVETGIGHAGYVAMLGKPNVGKSTLSNQMIGQKLSIVKDKPQTTSIEFLMILFDTPGVIGKKMHKLDSMMMKNVHNAAVNADCVLVVVDACKAPRKIDEVLEEGIGDLKN